MWPALSAEPSLQSPQRSAESAEPSAQSPHCRARSAVRRVQLLVIESASLALLPDDHAWVEEQRPHWLVKVHSVPRVGRSSANARVHGARGLACVRGGA